MPWLALQTLRSSLRANAIPQFRNAVRAMGIGGPGFTGSSALIAVGEGNASSERVLLHAEESRGREHLEQSTLSLLQGHPQMGGVHVMYTRFIHRAAWGVRNLDTPIPSTV